MSPVFFDAFNGFDWFVVIVLGVSALVSLWRGFAREAMSLAGWILAFVGANYLAPVAAPRLAELVANPTGRYLLCWSGLFLLILVLSGFAARGVARLLHLSGLGLLDRVLGTVFGLARGVLIVMALVFLVRELVPPREQALLREAQLMPVIDQLLEWSATTYDAVRAARIPELSRQLPGMN